jgi:hypothetical protein
MKNFCHHFFHLIPAFLLLINQNQVKAGIPDSLHGVCLDLRCHYGFVMRHHMDMGVYTISHFPSFEASISREVDGSKIWHQLYHYPTLGVSYWYSNLGNTSILGDVHALFPWIRFPLVRKERFTLNFRLGIGLGYFQKKFDRYSNYKNLAIGSHLNGNIQLLYDLRYSITQHLCLSAGIGIAHFSNGTMITPNYGVNVPALSAGLSWQPAVVAKVTKSNNEDLNPIIKHEFTFDVINGIKKVHPILGKTYLVFAVSGTYLSPISLKHKVGLGFDVFHDASDKDLVFRTYDIKPSEMEISKPGLKAVYEWDMDKLAIDFEMGIYLYQMEKSTGAIYDKLVIKYFVLRDCYLNCYLKTHYARADFIGWGIGYRFCKTTRQRGEHHDVF